MEHAQASARRGRGKQLRPGEQQGICLRAPLRIARAVHAAGVDRVVPRQNVIQTQEILERVILRDADDQLLARCDGQKAGALLPIDRHATPVEHEQQRVAAGAFFSCRNGREQRPAVIEVIALHHLLVQTLRVPLLHIGRIHFVAVADVVFKLQHHLPPHFAVDERFDVAALCRDARRAVAQGDQLAVPAFRLAPDDRDVPEVQLCIVHLVSPKYRKDLLHALRQVRFILRSELPFTGRSSSRSFCVPFRPSWRRPSPWRQPAPRRGPSAQPPVRCYSS